MLLPLPSGSAHTPFLWRRSEEWREWRLFFIKKNKQTKQQTRIFIFRSVSKTMTMSPWLQDAAPRPRSCICLLVKGRRWSGSGFQGCCFLGRYEGGGGSTQTKRCFYATSVQECPFWMQPPGKPPWETFWFGLLRTGTRFCRVVVVVSVGSVATNGLFIHS